MKQLIPLKVKAYCEKCGAQMPNNGVEHFCEDVVASDMLILKEVA